MQQTAENTATLSNEERKRILNLKVAELAGNPQKWQLQSASETSATMVTPRLSYLLPHMILCVLTLGFWFFVAVPIEVVRYLLYGGTSHHRVVVDVGEDGVISLETDRVKL